VIRLALRVPRERAELALAELLELAPAGVEELEIDEWTIEYAVYGAPGELPALPDLRALAGGIPVEIATTEVADDWQERWRDFHRPVAIESPPGGSGRKPVPALRVRPPWEPPEPLLRQSRIELVIDPGQAFGTGGHATTRLCLELLLELLAEEGPGGAVLDVGTGSGVLAIAAGRLGMGPLLGLDNEQESVAAAAENAAVNGVELETRRFDLRREPLPWLGESPGGERVIVLANLLRPLLLELAGAAVRAPAHLIAGGLLEGELDEVSGAFGERLEMRERNRRTSGGWGAMWLTSAS
jgi:ribosomal protein L11 methyltransferase